MNAQNKKNMLHISCRQLCNQIHKIGGCTTFNWCPQKRITPLQSIGMQQNTLDLPSSGITRKERYTFTCLDTYQKPYYDSTIRNQRRSRTCHTHTLHPNMELKSNTHQTPTTPPPSTRRQLNTYRRLQEPSYIMDGQSTIPFSPHSVGLRQNKRNRREQKKY